MTAYDDTCKSGKTTTISSITPNEKPEIYELRVYSNSSDSGKLLARAKFSSNGSAVDTDTSASTKKTMLKIYPEEGDSLKVGALVSGKNASSVKYSSSNSKIAKVTTKGKIKALSVGNAIITVKSGNTSIKIYVVVEEDD